MKITLSLLTTLVLSGATHAQVQDILASGHAFTDATTGTNFTSVDIGTSIRWTAGANAPHTVTSGQGSSDSNAGVLFAQTLQQTGDAFSYLPGSVGVIPYFCFEHEQHGMSGTLLVNPVTTDHVVHANHHSFFDEVDGSNVTHITLGETVRWVAGVNAPHTITSGAGSTDPNAGALFSSGTLGQGQEFAFTPTAPGVIPYFCFEHEQHGMSGTIHVMPTPKYPGTGEDLDLRTGVNSAADAVDVKTMHAGDHLVISLDSEQGTFHFSPMVLAIQAFATGNPPAGGLPGLNFDGSAILISGVNGGLTWPLLLPPGGATFAFQVPTLPAGVSFLVQGAVVSGAAQNQVFAASDAHELQIP